LPQARRNQRRRTRLAHFFKEPSDEVDAVIFSSVVSLGTGRGIGTDVESEAMTNGQIGFWVVLWVARHFFI
jgi:hypothetical protein